MNIYVCVNISIEFVVSNQNRICRITTKQSPNNYIGTDNKHTINVNGIHDPSRTKSMLMLMEECILAEKNG